MKNFKFLESKLLQNLAIFLIVVLLVRYTIQTITNIVKGGIVDASRDTKNDKSNLLQSNLFYKNFALRLKNSMEGVQFADGWALFGDERRAAMLDLLDRNDDEIIEVSNKFNNIVPSPETLRTWVSGELMTSTQADNQLLDRMSAIGLP
jgi:hypothetical protein